MFSSDGWKAGGMASVMQQSQLIGEQSCTDGPSIELVTLFHNSLSFLYTGVTSLGNRNRVFYLGLQDICCS